jgi:hypothetical protein
VPLLLPDGGRAASAQSERQICASETVDVPVNLGPFKQTACGEYEVAHLAQARLLGSPDPAVASVATLPVRVTDCPGDAFGLPSVSADKPKPLLQEVHTWSVRVSHNGSNPLVFKQKEPVKVEYSVQTAKSPGKRSLDLEGSVALEAPDGKGMLLKSATVRGWGRGGVGWVRKRQADWEAARGGQH